MVERLIITVEVDNDLLTLTGPDSSGDVRFTIHNDTDELTAYVDRDELLTIIKFLTKFL